MKQKKNQVKFTFAISTLEDVFGIPSWRRKDPLDELMLTIISQNTNDKNRDQAYARLRDRFPDWVDVKDANAEQIAEAIKPAGLSNQKSKRMKEILVWIEQEFGELNLNKLRELSDEDAITLLTARKGIGIKTAAVMLAFSLDRDLCPVDTHVHRIAKRIGWVKEKDNADKTYFYIQQFIPEGKAPTFHLNLLKFGRTICTARNPQCLECPLYEICEWKEKKLR